MPPLINGKRVLDIPLIRIKREHTHHPPQINPSLVENPFATQGEIQCEEENWEISHKFVE